MQGKRGIEKQPFQLPDFIAATGIEKIRQVRLNFSFSSFTFIIILHAFYIVKSFSMMVVDIQLIN